MVVGGGGILEDVGGICCIFSFIFEVGGGGDVIPCIFLLWYGAVGGGGDVIPCVCWL